MSSGLSKSQIDRLGLRLVERDRPADGDLELLHELLLDRSRQLDRAEARVRDELSIVPTSRVKNTATILEKLRRGDGSGLKSIQDLAGMRIVGDFGRGGQDEVVARIAELFGECERLPKIVDRRAEPMHGYRAVHVIVFPEDSPLEIQVRTRWQHEWAEFFEKLADLVGRGIRYGEPPIRSWTPADARDRAARERLKAQYEVRAVLVEMALDVAGMIDAVETGEVLDPDNPRLSGYRREVEDALVALRQHLDGVRDAARPWP